MNGRKPAGFDQVEAQFQVIRDLLNQLNAAVAVHDPGSDVCRAIALDMEYATNIFAVMVGDLKLEA